MNPNPIGSMTGSMRYDTPHCSSAATLGSSRHGRADLVGVERVDAHPHPLAHELAHHIAEAGEFASGCAADVDHIGTARAIVLRLPADRVTRETWREIGR